MRELKGLKNLRYLSIKYTKVSDAGLKHLKELKNLKALIVHTSANVPTPRGLSETPVTAAGAAELQRTLPNCRIAHR